MKELGKSEYEAWQEDTAVLVDALADLFESTEARFYIDERNNTLYIELEGLNDYEEEEIADLAEPVLSDLDLDFEDIVLLPFKP